MDDRLLVKRAKRGDVDAFAELYGTIYEKLYHFAYYMLKNAQDAEDAVSEAVTDAFEGIRKLKREEYMQLRQEFMKLPEEDRLIIGMHVFFGYKTREIAAFLKMNENTVRSKESRAIQKLAKQLDGLR